jgi:zinc protease
MIPLGTETSINTITQEKIAEFYGNYCGPDNMVLAVFGDFDAAVLREKLKKNFASVPAEASKRNLQAIRETNIIPPEEIVKFLDKEQALVLMGFHGIDVTNNEKYPFAVITSLLSGEAGRLKQAIREKKGLSYTMGAFAVWGIDPGYYCLYAATVPEKVDEVKQEMIRQIEILRTETVDDKEIEQAKKELIGTYIISLQSNAELAFRVALDELYGLGYDNYFHFKEKIQTVTNEDIQRIAHEYFDLKKYALVIVRPDQLNSKLNSPTAKHCSLNSSFRITKSTRDMTAP